jgi:hypothetical protein
MNAFLPLRKTYVRCAATAVLFPVVVERQVESLRGFA